MSIKQRQKEVEVLKPLKTETTLETKTTYETDIKTENRIKAGRNIYTITYVNNDGRYSTVYLSLVK